MAIAKIELVAPSIFGRFGDLAASVIQYVIIYYSIITNKSTNILSNSIIL